MALADKKHTRMYSTDGSDGDRVDSTKLARIEAEFNNNEYISDDGQFDMIAPVIYQMQKMQDELDELRRYLIAEVGDGAAGSDGARGAAGSDGARGAAGSDGNNGAAGSAGSDGARGSAGSAGAAGSDGARGAAGAAGSDGARGAAGSDGADGTTPTMTSLNGSGLPTSAPRTSGLLWNNRGVVTIA